MAVTKTSDEQLSHHDELLHIRETINMLCLAVCQIEASLNESNGSVSDLTQSFTELAQHHYDVDTSIQAMSTNGVSELTPEVLESSEAMREKINMAITAFQFYDRISQRLDHVARNLERVSSVIGNPKQLNDPEIWGSIQDKVKSSYTMESERIMFEHIMRGASVKEALEIYNHHFSSEKDEADTTTDEIELF